jgi:hypothetical protein
MTFNASSHVPGIQLTFQNSTVPRGTTCTSSTCTDTVLLLYGHYGGDEPNEGDFGKGAQSIT